MTSGGPDAEPGGLEIHQAHPERQLDEARVEAVVRAACQSEGFRIVSLGIVLADHATVHDINRDWLNHDYETDVVSFVLDETALARREVDGEVYVDLDTAAERAPEFDSTPEQEALRYIVHGLLHLMGYDDATPPEREQMRLREDAALQGR